MMNCDDMEGNDDRSNSLIHNLDSESVRLQQWVTYRDVFIKVQFISYFVYNSDLNTNLSFKI